MTEEQIKQATAWLAELAEIKESVCRFADKFDFAKGASSRHIARTVRNARNIINSIDMGDFYQAAQDNDNA